MPTNNYVIVNLTEGTQFESWNALLDLYEDVPYGWSLVGARWSSYGAWNEAEARRVPAMRQIWCSTRAHPQVLREVANTLTEKGFSPDGVTRSRHQHRWTRSGTVIDVLIPRHFGNAVRLCAGGAKTLETPGAQKVLNRTKPCEVLLNGRPGVVLRPTLLDTLGANGISWSR